MASDELCFCECHKYPGFYWPPCPLCGHDHRHGRMVGGSSDGWKPSPRLARLEREREEQVRKWWP